MDTELEYAEWTLQSKEIVTICRDEDFGLSTLFAYIFFVPWSLICESPHPFCL